MDQVLQGEMSNPGVVPRAIQDVFDIIEKTPDRDFLLRMSMMEIYNEVILKLRTVLAVLSWFAYIAWSCCPFTFCKNHIFEYAQVAHTCRHLSHKSTQCGL